MRIWPLLLLMIATLLCACTSTPPAPSGGQFVDREINLAGTRHRYQVFVPASRATDKPAPVILFLHGAGERGNDNRLPASTGIGAYIRRHPDSFPAIVVFPQVPDGQYWTDNNVGMALAALDAASREFDGDADRTYLTGLSMGGYGTWELALQQPERFAALVPVCGAITPPPIEGFADLRISRLADAPDRHVTLASRLRHVPIWIFHGARDEVVSPEDSRRIFAALQRAGGDVRYTEFPDADHNSWDPAYTGTPDLWTWLFAQKR